MLLRSSFVRIFFLLARSFWWRAHVGLPSRFASRYVVSKQVIFNQYTIVVFATQKLLGGFNDLGDPDSPGYLDRTLACLSVSPRPT